MGIGKRVVYADGRGVHRSEWDAGVRLYARAGEAVTSFPALILNRR